MRPTLEQVRQARTQRVGQIAVKHPVFLELMCHPFVLAVWKKMLGEDIMCATWSANTTYPGFDSIGWHSDYPYWSLQPPWPPGNFAGQTLWLLDDFTVENGATAAIPYSHKKGHPPPPETRSLLRLGAPQSRVTGSNGSEDFRKRREDCF